MLINLHPKFSRGSLPIIIAIVVMGIILLFTIVTSAAMMGDRTGVGSGSTTPGGSTGGTSPAAPTGTGSGVCTGASVKAEPIRTPSVDAIPVSVPIWRYASQTSKSSSTMTLRVNRNCTNQIKNIFQNAYNSADKPPIKTSDTACYAARPNNTSMHNWGGACDVNWTENYCVYRSGGLCGPSGWWRPTTDVLSMPLGGSISNAFSSQGWSRGIWTRKLDYMHYSVNGQ